MILFSSVCLALVFPAWLLDQWLGEPRRFHPLVGFGTLAGAVEIFMRTRLTISASTGRLAGSVAVGILILPPVAVSTILSTHEPSGLFFQVVFLYLAIGGKSLEEHALKVFHALENGNLEESRKYVGFMVSRDTLALESPEVARATVESVLENGCDAIFGALFWFVLLGAPGAVLFRLANTLDAMWGYRNDRYRSFGWCAARLDDLLGYLPARLTAISYLALGQSRQAFGAWRRCTQRKSPNATLVMAVGGGALGLRLGGGGFYHGQWQSSPLLGGNAPPTPPDIQRATRLVAKTSFLWAFLSSLFGSVLIILS